MPNSLNDLKPVIGIFFAALLVVFCLSPSVFAENRRHGLFVGINEYPVSIGPLASCVNDATRMREALSTYYGFGDTDLLTNKAATRQGILDALKAFYQRSSRDDLFVFYYSGHGMPFPDALSEVVDETGQFEVPGSYPLGYYDSAIVPVDANEISSGKRWRNLILDDELYEIFSAFSKKGVKVVFISDSCISGTLAKGLDIKLKTVPPKVLFNVASWRRLQRPRGKITAEASNADILVIGSSQDSELSIAGNPETNTDMSLFTHYLLKALRIYRQKHLAFTYESILNAVGPVVSREAKKMKGAQTPKLDTRFYNGRLDMPIFSLPASGAAPVFSPPASSSSTKMVRMVIKVTDLEGNILPNCAIVIVKPKAVYPFKKPDYLMFGRTGGKGFFDSNDSTESPRELAEGTYQIKIGRNGYMSYTGSLTVAEMKNNMFVKTYKLARE